MLRLKRKEKREKAKLRIERIKEESRDSIIKKQNNKIEINKRNILKIVGIIVGVLVVIGMVSWFILTDNQMKIEGKAVQYYAGQIYEVEEGATLVRGLDETTMTDSTGTTSMSSIVIYQEEESKIILTQDMVYYDPRNSLLMKIDALSEVYYTEYGITAVNGNKEYALNKGFLYDGDDYFIFLEDVSVKFNGYLLELSPLSYIEAVFQSHVMTFDHDTLETMLEAPETEVEVTAGGSEYTISLIGDSIVNSKDEKSLLFSRPDLLDSVFD